MVHILSTKFFIDTQGLCTNIFFLFCLKHTQHIILLYLNYLMKGCLHIFLEYQANYKWQYVHNKLCSQKHLLTIHLYFFFQFYGKKLIIIWKRRIHGVRRKYIWNQSKGEFLCRYHIRCVISWYKRKV